jgi:gamma-glutamylcyclotransferase (GGCT)/AIG2-like uncharacterized protein YtfP
VEPARLNVFVYGTLKRGERNHERFCRGVLAVREATVRGRLYELPYGLPALVVPEEDVLAMGTTDYSADAKTQYRAQSEPQECSLGPTVYGELFAFDNPEECLPALDGLEGFNPGKESRYERILIFATLSETGETVPTWAYGIKTPSGVHLPGGIWPAP